MLQPKLCTKKDRFQDPPHVRVVPLGEKKMDASLERRVNLATSWASNRSSVLDSFERYEDSYAIAQEFREWINSSSQHPEMLEDSCLQFPHSYIISHLEESVDSDELLEL